MFTGIIIRFSDGFLQTVCLAAMRCVADLELDGSNIAGPCFPGAGGG